MMGSKQPQQVATGQQVQAILGISNRERVKLAEAGLLRVAASAGTVTLYNLADVDAIKDRAPLDPAAHRPLLVVRLAEPREVHEGPDETGWTRRWMGWSQEWDEETKIKAAGAWWPVKNPDVLRNGTLVALVAHVVVGCWRITGYATDGPLKRFYLHPHADAARIVGKLDERDGSVRGGMTLRLGAGPKTVPFV